MKTCLALLVFLAALRRLQPSVALVVCSAHVDVFKRFRRFSHCCCITKPFDASELVDALRRAFASSPTGR